MMVNISSKNNDCLSITVYEYWKRISVVVCSRANWLLHSFDWDAQRMDERWGCAKKKIKYARKRIELTTSVMYAGMTPKSVGATLLRIYRGLWTTLRCYMRGVPRRDIDLYELRVNGPVEHLDLPGISFGSRSAASFPGSKLSFRETPGSFTRDDSTS